MIDEPVYLMVSGHDYRASRKANVHFITEELSKRGKTRLFSLGFSAISKLRGRDPRLGLEDRANKVERVEGVDCYLWYSLVHPGNFQHPGLRPLSELAFDIYRRSAPAVLSMWASEASVIFVESGIGVVMLEDLRRWNPSAKIIYIASDDMSTIGVAPYLSRILNRSAHLIDGARLPSRMLAAAMPPKLKLFYVPHGVDADLDEHADPSPYGEGLHAVSVGSMLFDPSFFQIAADAFPEVTFHVIGSGAQRSTLPASVIYYGEMPFQQTLPYLKHASVGVAPYRKAKLPYYLSDTSMKLMQYEYFGLPAVCPTFVVGQDHPLRFGYEPGDSSSIARAVADALAADRKAVRAPLIWSQVVDRILTPQMWADTAI